MPAAAKSQVKATSSIRTERKRRPRGTGSIRQRGDRFFAYWFVVDPATGARKQHSKSCPTREAAQAHLTEVLAGVQAGTWRPDTPLTVAQLIEEHWLPVRTSEGIRPTTAAQYREAAKWVTRQIGALRVDQLSPRRAADLVTALKTTPAARTGRGLSPRSVQLAITILKAATGWAARERMIPADPLATYKRPRLEKRAVGAWSAEQARAFLESVADDRFAACWALLATRGLRRGEIAGLRWSAVDLDSGRLRIESTRVVADGAVITSTPKTNAGARSVPLDPVLVAMFRRVAEQQAIEKANAADAYADSGYVMVDSLGRPMHPDSISRRFDALVKRAGLPRLTVHGLRHTAATTALAAGAPTKVVSDLLGHSSPTITLEIYAHTLPGMAEQVGEQLSAALISKTAGNGAGQAPTTQ